MFLLARRPKVVPQAPLLIDCGAISYRNEEIPKIRGEQVNASWVISQAKSIANYGDIICAPDHLLLPETNLKLRRKFNLENADGFLELCQQELSNGIIPMKEITHPKGAEIVFIGGKRYREFVIPQLLSIPDTLYTARAPLAGLGIGYQMQWLKQKTPKYKHLQLALL